MNKTKRHQASVKRLFSLALALVCLGSMATGEAVEPQSEYKIKSAYLYNFSKFTRLPEKHFRKNNSNYDLCIVGASPFGHFLEPLSGRDVHGRRLSLHYLNRNQAMDICEMVFITRAEKAQQDQLLRRAVEHNVLTVSDIDGFTARGGIIGLVTRGNRIRFQINQGVAQSCGISISAKLLELGELVTSIREKETFRCSE